LQSNSDEESRLRDVITFEYPAHMPEFSIAQHTGLRPSEQYSLTWVQVDLGRRFVTIPKSENGKVRHSPLNSAALAAFQELFSRSR